MEHWPGGGGEEEEEESGREHGGMVRAGSVGQPRGRG